MGRIIKGQFRRQLRATPSPVCSERFALEKVDWEHAICSVCLEAPHNAVLLLCSSYDKGCRPYMCGTSFRHSNCLDLFKKAYDKQTITALPNTQEDSASWLSSMKSDSVELSCPLCRGEVKGWTVVEPARRYLNKKRRSCIQDGCSFVGTYKELKKHVKIEHRRVKPRKVDPVLEAKWRALELQTAQQDVMSTIRSSMPRSVVLGDYVIDMDSSGGSDINDFDDDEDGGFDDEDGGDQGFRLGRRGSNRRDMSRSFFYFLLQEGARIARLRRDSTVVGHVDLNIDPAVGYQSEEVDAHSGVGRRRRMTANLIREGRRQPVGVDLNVPYQSEEVDAHSGVGRRRRLVPVNLIREGRRRPRRGRGRRRPMVDLMN